LSEPVIRNEEQRAEAAGAPPDRHPDIAALACVIPVGILRSDLEGRCFYISERATDLTGLTAESALESGWEQCVHPDDREAIVRQVSLALHTRKPWQAEFRCLLPGGHTRWLLSQATPEHDLQGHVVGFVWTVSDITHVQVLSERLLRNEERQAFLLRLSDALRPLSNPLDVQEISSKLLGEHLGVNRVGYTELEDREYVIRREYVCGVAPLAGQGPLGSFAAALRDAFRNGETVVVEDVETDPRFTESERVAMRARQIAAFVGVMLLKEGQLVAAFGANNATPRSWAPAEVALIREVAERTWDAVERARAEAALLARRDAERDRARTIELEQRTEQLSRLASDLTLAEQHAREQLAKTLHDGLQQLLVGAALNLERHVNREAQRGTGPDELLVRAKGHLDAASAAARSLSLELFPPALHGSGLPAALTWLAERTRNQYGLVVEVFADPLANSDRKDVRTLLFESVRELLFNAVKHAQVDRVTIDLSLDQDDALCITVADQGIGFDPAGLVERAKAGKAGWGLFSIRERLTLLGGRFDIESAPGQGTRFRLVAPRGEAQGGIDADRRASRVATRAALQDGVGSPALRALKILVVDDHAGVRRVFRELLQERPEFDVVGEAADGLEAIAGAHTLRPDVILMDVSMPVMDGVEATRRIRAELPFIQILGLSTQLRTDELHAIELVGAAGFYTKGVDTQRLIDHLMAVHVATTLELPGQPV